MMTKYVDRSDFDIYLANKILTEVLFSVYLVLKVSVNNQTTSLQELYLNLYKYIYRVKNRKFYGKFRNTCSFENKNFFSGLP